MGIDAYADSIIKMKARHLVKTHSFTKDDLDDITQQLRLDLLERTDQFDPQRGTWEGFVTGVIDSRIASIIDHRTMQKRDPRCEECSIHDPITDEDGLPVELVVTMPAGNHCPADRDLAIDLADAVEELPPRLQRLCARRKVTTVTEIAREFGVSRKTVYAWIKRVETVFRAKGLDEYL